MVSLYHTRYETRVNTCCVLAAIMICHEQIHPCMYVFVFLTEQYDPSHYEKTHPHGILQVPTTQLAKMSIDLKFVELTADVLEIFL